MTIRARLNLWYSTVLCAVALVVVSAACYHELVIEHRHHQHPSESENDSENLLDVLTWTLTPAVALGVLGGWWLTRRALAPVADLTGALEKIHDKNLGEKIPRSGNGDELDRLTEVFNAMTERLAHSFQHIREFTLHASHELKTPLTVLHGEIETELGAANLPAEQREKLASQLDEIQRLTKIVDGLTLLTKADAGQVALTFAPVSLDEIIREVFEDTQILAKSADISVSLAACEPVKIAGDRHRLRQLLLNLADNAVKYNRPGGTVEFSLRRAGGGAEIKIANTGAGIPPQHLPRVFERFFRGAAAHPSVTDGCGLGLSIVQWIARAHHGVVKIESEPARLTTVTVGLPLAT
jgi:signal transduction histidine kinase